MPPPDPLGILLISGSYERAHYAFMLAAAAAAVGRPAIIFATNAGCHAVAIDWRNLTDAGNDAGVQQRGVAGLDALRDAAAELGVRLLACDAGLRLIALGPAALLPGVEVAGIPTFLSAVGGGQIVTL